MAASTRADLPAPGSTTADLPSGSSVRLPAHLHYEPPPLGLLTLSGSGSLALTASVATTMPLTGAGAVALATSASTGLSFSGDGDLSFGSTTDASFSGSGTLALPTAGSPGFATSGSGELAAIARPQVSLAGSGSGTVAMTTRPNAAPAFNGSGTLSMTAAAAFAPASMTKNGDFAVPTTYAVVTSWLADTTGYPGSTVSGNALLASSASSNATVTVSVTVMKTTSFSRTIRLALYRGATLLGQMPAAVTLAAQNVPEVVTYSVPGVALAQGDQITVQAVTNTINNIVIQGGAASYVRITA